MAKKLCKNCIYLDGRGACGVLQMMVEPNVDSCPRFVDQSAYEGNCVICGKPIYVNNSIFDPINENDFRILHLQCAKLLGTCQTCKNGQICEFQTNPDPTPQVVIETVRQGNMVMQKQVRNPSRIEKFCYSCSCFSHENGCLKENNCCDGKWEER